MGDRGVFLARLRKRIHRALGRAAGGKKASSGRSPRLEPTQPGAAGSKTTIDLDSATVTDCKSALALRPGLSSSMPICAPPRSVLTAPSWAGLDDNLARAQDGPPELSLGMPGSPKSKAVGPELSRELSTPEGFQVPTIAAGAAIMLLALLLLVPVDIILSKRAGEGGGS